MAGYYSARRDHILVKRIHWTGNNSIGTGRFGAGQGGILVSPNEIIFCKIVFTPLRKLEEIYWNKKESNK